MVGSMKATLSLESAKVKARHGLRQGPSMWVTTWLILARATASKHMRTAANTKADSSGTTGKATAFCSMRMVHATKDSLSATSGRDLGDTRVRTVTYSMENGSATDCTAREPKRSRQGPDTKANSKPACAMV